MYRKFCVFVSSKISKQFQEFDTLTAKPSTYKQSNFWLVNAYRQVIILKMKKSPIN